MSNEDSFDGVFDHLDPGASMVCKEDSFEYRVAIFKALREIGSAFTDFKRETRQSIKELVEVVERQVSNHAKHEATCGKDREKLNERLAAGIEKMDDNASQIKVLKMQMLMFNGACYLLGVFTAAAIGKLFGMY